MRSSVRRARACAALLPFALSVALAQEASVEPVSARTYVPQDFARFAPRNALNMLQQVPGFVIRAQATERGLGQATGNVLIDGQRVSGKSNDVLGQLERIPAGNVVRIEIRDGATLDIPGLSGQVANVVTQADGLTGQWEWRPEWRSDYSDPLLSRGSVSVSGSMGRTAWTAGFANLASHGAAGGPTTIRNADGSLRESRNDEWDSETEAPTLTTQLAWRGNDDAKANLNARYQHYDSDYKERGIRVAPGQPHRFRTMLSERGGYNYEIGGDYEFAFGPGRWKFIALDRFTHLPKTDTVTTIALDASMPSEASRFAREGDERERIARTEYRWKDWGGDVQVSGEYAFNSLDSRSFLFALDPSGVFVPSPMAGGTATVQEDRYEIMGSYGRALTPTLQLQINAGGEYSRLEQAGAGGQARTFLRPKGLVSLAWTQSANTDYNLSLERRVGQLNFYDFLASVDLGDGQDSAGNPELVPPQVSELALEANRKLGAWGNTTLRAYAQRIDDIVDTIPIGAEGESPGNLDRATAYGFEWKGTFQLAPLGWTGAKLDATWQMERSEVEDPLTFERRPISNNLQSFAKLDLRHDIPGTNWAWGGNANYTFRELDYRLSEVGRQWEGPVFGGVFIEHKDVFGLKVRFNASNLGEGMSMWDRTVYVDRRDGPVAYHQMRNQRIRPIFGLTIGGKF